MVSGRDAIFRFRVDDRQFTQKVRSATASLNQMKSAASSTGASVGQLGTSMQTTGRQSAASAVNFQTATQGALNLSTAMVQTYTSISNLDRANNRAKQSIIAVARAEDLLNNKQQRLNELEESGIKTGMKYANMQREIATATSDLTVKQEKMRIEQDAVNDIYLLFAANVANVTISSLQTITILVGQEKVARVAATIATKLHFGAMRTAASVAYQEAIAKGVNTKAAVVNTGANIGLAKSFHAVAAASKAAAAANPVLLGAVVAITAAFIIYEANILGVKDAINGLLGIEDDFASSLEEARLAAEEAENATGEFANTLKFQMPDSLAVARLELIKYNGELDTYIRRQKEANRVRWDQRTAYIAQNPDYLKNARAAQAQNGKSFFGIRLPELFPTAYADSGEGRFVDAGYVNQIKLPELESRMENLESIVSVLTPFVNDPAFRRQIINQQRTAKSLSGNLNSDILRSIREKDFFDPANPTDIEKLEAQIAGIPLQELQLRKVFTVADTGITGRSIFQGQTLSALRGKIVNGVPIGNVLRGRLRQAELNRDTPRELGDGEQSLFNFLVKNNNVGVSTTMKTKLLNALLEPGNRGKVAFLTGQDIGNVANSLNVYAAEQIGLKELALSKFRGGEGGRSAGLLANVGGNATRFFQVPRGSIKIDPIFATRRQNRDNNANRLRTGGTRLVDEFGVPLFDLAEEGAVRGGYLTLSAMRTAARQELWRNNDSSRGFLSLLGANIPNGGNRQAAIRQANKAIAAANEARGLLSRTGLSLSYFGHRKVKKGGGYARSSQYWDNYRASIIASNQLTLKRGGQIDILNGGFGLGEYYGSGASFDSLQSAVAEQDALIQSIGLNRTEAFKIIDTTGRGRNEIDDRVRWVENLESISTGNSVL